MKYAFFISLMFISLTSMASLNKKSRALDLGLVRKSASTDEVQFMPETDPNKRGLEQERYTALDQLEWLTSDALSAEKAVMDSHSQYQQQIRFNQALQNLPRISIQTPATYK